MDSARVLVVEDDALLRASLARGLAENGFGVTTVGDGAGVSARRTSSSTTSTRILKPPSHR